MIDSLYIENIAVIEKTSIDFTAGFNVLTGETGAGKSIIIDSINAVLGQRTSKDIIRTGAQKAFVSASFSNIPKSTCEILKEYDMSPEDDCLVLQRELTLSGKNNCKINDRPVTVSALRTIAQSLINIHGQHETNEIMNSQSHIDYLDRYGEFIELLNKFRDEYSKLLKLKSQLRKTQTDDSERERKIDLLKYQIEEISKWDISAEEYNELTNRKNLLANSEKIKNSLNEAYYRLSGGEEDSGVTDLLEQAVYSIENITDCFPQLSEISERLNNSLAEIEDCSSEIAVELENADYNPYELEEIEEKLDAYYKLCKKYGPEIEDVIKYGDTAEKELNELNNYAINRDELQKTYKICLSNALELAAQISAKRKNAADKFSAAVKKELEFLDMPKVRFFFNVEECPLNENGIDNVEMLISTNPGEEPKPVARIASGGELSRIMLAIKNVLSDKDDVGTLIFDEIDTGISGSASSKVGQELKSTSNVKQVICVTHQAQIACLADTHFLIKKEVKNDKTYTRVTPLGYDSRVIELARLIDGKTESEISLNHARAMLNNY